MSLSASSIPETSYSLLFEPVTASAEAVAIVATGPSARGVGYHLFAPHVHVIAVKGSIHDLPRADSWFTVDANDRTRKHHMQKRREGTHYYAAVPPDYGSPNALVPWHRRPAEPDVHFLRRIQGETRKCNVFGLSEDPTSIHTGNSAWGALGLAYHMRPRRIALFGVDGSQSVYGLGGAGRPRGWLGHLPDLFASAMPQLGMRRMEVRNGSLRSNVTCFPRLHWGETIKWLNDA